MTNDDTVVIDGLRELAKLANDASEKLLRFELDSNDARKCFTELQNTLTRTRLMYNDYSVKC